MASLTLHGRSVLTVFDLLGTKENDLTYALGWGLANADRLMRALLEDIGGELKWPASDSVEAVRLQEFIRGSGFTDIEIETDVAHLIIEAKRGWDMPTRKQLTKYATSFHPGRSSALLVLAEGSPSFARGRYPDAVSGKDGASVPVIYRSWEQLARLASEFTSGSSNQARLVAELVRYLKGLVNMQDVRDNLVYVVSLAEHADWAPPDIQPRQIVLDKNHYFHPVGNRYPHEPANYLGFRFDGRLQQIRHAEKVVVTQTPADYIDGWDSNYDLNQPHYLYSLGPTIVPNHTVKTGRKIVQARRVWAAIDLLLTSRTIQEAEELTRQRLDDAGGI